MDPDAIRSKARYAVSENRSGGAARPRKKSDDIFIRFDAIPACDGHTTTAIAMRYAEHRAGNNMCIEEIHVEHDVFTQYQWLK